MKMLFFYFLTFLNLLQPISTNPPGPGIYILDKMDKLCLEIVPKLIKLEELRQEMGTNVGIAIFKKEFPTEIMKAKVVVEKYLRREKRFTDIFKALNSLKLEYKKLKTLQELQNTLNLKMEEQQKKSNFGKFGNFIANPFGILENTEKELELVNLLINTNEVVDKFVDGIILELQIRQPIKDFLYTLEYRINEQMAQFKFEVPYNAFSEKYSHVIFPIIQEYIVEAKEKLQEDGKILSIPKSATDIMPHQLKNDLDKLKKAIFNPEPFLEKVERKPTEWHSHFDDKEESRLFVDLNEDLNKAVDELPHKIDVHFKNDKILMEFAKLHSEFDDLQSLNIASNRMLFRIKRLLFEEQTLIEENLKPKYLVHIDCLAEFIKEKFEKMNITSDCHIPNMEIAKKMDELPEELEIKEEMEPKTEAILIAQNLLFLAAQLSKWHDFRGAVRAIQKSKDKIFQELIWKEMPPKSIGQFFYKKYEETKGEYKLETGMSTKNEHHNAGSSSTNEEANERNFKGLKRGFLL